MATQTVSKGIRTGARELLSRQQWIKIGLMAALPTIVLVIAVQALAIATWPEVASFKPLDNYARTAIFILIPALIATALFARLTRNSKDPVASFVKIAVIVLLLSFIPDYLLPLANKTFLASSVAAFLHLIAGVLISAGLIAGYKRAVR
jgi:hypothetical protein